MTFILISINLKKVKTQFKVDFSAMGQSRATSVLLGILLFAFARAFLSNKWKHFLKSLSEYSVSGDDDQMSGSEDVRWCKISINVTRRSSLCGRPKNKRKCILK